MRLTKEEYDKIIGIKGKIKKNKYGSNNTIEINGIKFQSKLEYKRYNFLTLMVKLGKIKSFEYEPKKFILQKSFKYNGKNYPIITYTPDFKVILNNGDIYWEDTKSISTKKKESYRIKMKLFVRQYIVDGNYKDFKEIFIENEIYF